jgi:hypothetical protein
MGGGLVLADPPETHIPGCGYRFSGVWVGVSSKIPMSYPCTSLSVAHEEANEMVCLDEVVVHFLVVSAMYVISICSNKADLIPF